MWDVLSRVAKNDMGGVVPGCFVIHSRLFYVTYPIPTRVKDKNSNSCT